LLAKSRRLHGVRQSWSGDELSVLSRVQRFLGLPRTQNGVPISCLIGGIIVIALYFSSISLTSKNGEVVKLSVIPLIYQPYLTGYVVAILFVGAFTIWRKSFRTPEIKSNNCHWCGAVMITSELTCQNCAAISAKNKKLDQNE
jgi:hypothetical protein